MINLSNNYIEQSKGLKKTNLFCDFFSKTLNKNAYEYVNKISKYFLF